MTTTPIWIALIVGILGGIGSALLTQLISWRREAAARSYEHRREAYVDFIKEFYRRRKEIATLGIGSRGISDDDDDNDAPPGDYLTSLQDHLTLIEIFGTKKAALLANEAFNVLVNVVFGDDEDVPEAERILELFQRQVRIDLSIPDPQQMWIILFLQRLLRRLFH